MMYDAITGKLRAISDRVIVSDMNFGEQVTKSGIVIRSNDGTPHGVHARWGRVYCKGNRNTDPYEPGDWVLVEHGRWTRGFSFNDGDQELELRMVEAEAILLYSDTKPNTLEMGKEYANGDSFSSDQFIDTAKMVS